MDYWKLGQRVFSSFGWIVSDYKEIYPERFKVDSKVEDLN